MLHRLRVLGTPLTHPEALANNTDSLHEHSVLIRELAMVLSSPMPVGEKVCWQVEMAEVSCSHGGGEVIYAFVGRTGRGGTRDP
jgi:hypothetical protein